MGDIEQKLLQNSLYFHRVSCAIMCRAD